MRVALFTFLLVPLLLAGCASTTEVSTRFLDEEPVVENNRLLLAARSPETDVRDSWERTCAEIFRNAGFQVTRSARHLPRWQETGVEGLFQWAGANDHGLILAVDLTSLLILPGMPREQEPMGPQRHDRRMEPTWTIEIGPGREDRAAEMERGPLEMEARLMTGSGQPLWEAETRTDEASAVEPIARSQCRALVDALREHDLVPGKRVPGGD